MKARIWFLFCHPLLGRIFSPLWTKSPPVIENYAIYSELSLNTTAIAKMTVYLVSYWFISAGTTTSAQSSFRTCITAYRCHSLTTTTTTCASKWADTTNWNIRNKLPSVSDNKKKRNNRNNPFYCLNCIVYFGIIYFCAIKLIPIYVSMMSRYSFIFYSGSALQCFVYFPFGCCWLLAALDMTICILSFNWKLVHCVPLSQCQKCIA